jgi:hypothetical protein
VSGRVSELAGELASGWASGHWEGGRVDGLAVGRASARLIVCAGPAHLVLQVCRCTGTRACERACIIVCFWGSCHTHACGRQASSEIHVAGCPKPLCCEGSVLGMALSG